MSQAHSMASRSQSIGRPTPSPLDSLTTATSGTATARSDDTQTEEVESPSLSTPQARARFEFEPGKGNKGTKILMVEWEDDESTSDIRGAWTISWEGKSTVLPAEGRNVADSNKAELQAHRMFFLLPPNVSIPALVTLTLAAADSTRDPVVWRTNPLPAIFPPGFAELAVGGKTSKGVLHTLWAKKRLSTLQSEIEKEERLFPEGIGLDMALQEKEWIEESFGLSPGVGGNSSHRHALRNLGDVPQSPTSPLSPGGSRLSEKLKGLKLQTSSDGTSPSQDLSNNPLSPENTDIAVPSFSAFKGTNPATLAAQPAQRPAESGLSRHFGGHKLSGQSAGASVGSLAEMMAGTTSDSRPAQTAQADDNEEDEGDLFALPLSPRSPEMTKSPFTFASSDTARYLEGDQAQRVA